MSISAEQVKELRAATGAGILDCRNALEKAGGDLDKAVDILREKGLAQAAQRSDRETLEGYLELYSHGDGRVGVMVEVNSETDFVARSETFRNFAHEIALQVAAAAPRYLDVEDIPPQVIEEFTDDERMTARRRILEEGKPESIVDRIVEGRLEKFKDEVCLMRQTYIRDEDLTVKDLLHQTIASLGENIVIRRFVRWEVGEETSP
jgi:elongation factor Ts